ncbi:MAG: hypothetical protein AB1468_01985 [Candidatus Micrarchaeota archaeon]
MKCYVHGDHTACAVCARCKKGICEECANEVEGRKYCHSCVEKLEEELIAIQARAHAKKHALPEEKEKGEAQIARGAKEEEEEEIEEREERHERPERPEHRRAPEAPPWVDRKALEEKKEEKPKIGPIIPPLKFKQEQEAGAKSIWAPKPSALAPPAPSGPKQVLKISTREMMLPALVGGMLMGFAMGIPPLYLCCASWVIGGVVSVYMVSLNSPSGGIVGERDAMRIGALTGLFGVVIGVVVMFTANTMLKDILMFPMSQYLGAEYAHFLLGLAKRDVAIKFVSMIVLFPALGVLGGVLASRYMKRK